MSVKLMKKYSVPIILGVLAAILIWGNFGEDLQAKDPSFEHQLRKFNYLLLKIRDDYVEQPDMIELLDGAITGMLEELDPHSIYIPAQEQSRLSERFAGEFEGIGISFVIQHKILTVISPIPGTPADQLGIRAGDRIVKINGESAYGITNEDVFLKLRGPKGTQVDVSIDRDGVEELLEFTITRDKIPINSVETYFMLDDNTGYLLLNQFTATTTDELVEALQDLQNQGMTQLVFDLRGNSGGYLDQAVKVCDLFIKKGDRLVFTRGRDPKSERSYYAKNNSYNDLDLVVLINHGSASAAEIVSGAVQDLDRGLVAGTRSFGKGLVQTPLPFDDGSLVRLTTARYYTPSGRLIQRPYTENTGDYYREAFSDDEVKVEIDSTKDVYFTKAGRKVFGGGGIEPDVRLESHYYTSYTPKLLNKRLFFEYASKYSSEHPELAGNFDAFLNDFEIDDQMLADLVKLAEENDIPIEEENFRKDQGYLKSLLKSELAQSLFNGRLYYYQIRIRNDQQVQEAMKLFPQAREIAALNR